MQEGHTLVMLLEVNDRKCSNISFQFMYAPDCNFSKSVQMTVRFLMCHSKQ